LDVPSHILRAAAQSFQLLFELPDILAVLSRPVASFIRINVSIRTIGAASFMADPSPGS
jgi:hypothetical protein